MLISALVSDKECKELYKIGKVVENNIVEIGSFQGESTTCLAKGSIDGNKVKIYAIDLWNLRELSDKVIENYKREIEKKKRLNFKRIEVWERFLQRLQDEKIEEYVIPVKGSSVEIAKVWNSPIGALFIDGDHSYKGCLNDYLEFGKHVVSGGYIIFHDVTGEGVKKVIEKHLIPSDKWFNYKYIPDTVLFIAEKK